MLTADRLIGLAQNELDIIAGVNKSFEISACKFRRTHEYYLKITPVQFLSLTLGTVDLTVGGFIDEKNSFKVVIFVKDAPCEKPLTFHNKLITVAV